MVTKRLNMAHLDVFEIVQMLLDKGANVNAPDGWHGNAVQIVATGGNTKIRQMLQDHGANMAYGRMCH
ncbi:hypothetical protein LY76DRAFT_508075 [Colletotrichum caudatum]|nr:hypothetical protein LY76DRAFT_508075 [Colletotrichum caudatum]